MRTEGLMLAAIGGALLLAGCAHNDVMVFGTNTSLGLDVQSTPKQGTGPSIVLGYKREEAVWMPLVVNGQGSRVAPCSIDAVASPPTATCSDQPWTPGDAKYTSEQTTTGANGAQVVQRDVYSVFASLGADFSANGASANVGASGGLAQFFATGNAAINISANEALVTALKVESPGGAGAQAQAVGAAASNSSVDNIMAGAPPVPAGGSPAANLRARRVSLAMACALPADGSYRWPQILAATPYASNTTYQALTADQLPGQLNTNPALLSAALTAGATPAFNCPST